MLTFEEISAIHVNYHEIMNAMVNCLLAEKRKKTIADPQSCWDEQQEDDAVLLGAQGEYCRLMLKFLRK